MPGTYQLVDSMRVNDLIFKAGGVNGSTYRIKANILRSEIEDHGSKLITINLKKAMENDLKHNLLLNLKDRANER